MVERKLLKKSSHHGQDHFAFLNTFRRCHHLQSLDWREAWMNATYTIDGGLCVNHRSLQSPVQEVQQSSRMKWGISCPGPSQMEQPQVTLQTSQQQSIGDKWWTDSNQPWCEWSEPNNSNRAVKVPGPWLYLIWAASDLPSRAAAHGEYSQLVK